MVVFPPKQASFASEKSIFLNEAYREQFSNIKRRNRYGCVALFVVSVLFISFELEQVGESCHSKHLLQFAIQSADKDVAAFGLGILQDGQENAQSTR